LGGKENRSVNFYTLIEFYTFYQLKISGLSTQKINTLYKQLAKDLHTQYPFARTIHTDGKSIWYEQLNELVKADGKLQLDMKLLLAPFLKKIDFSNEGLAERYYPLDNSRNIVIDPNHQFGAPTITGTNIKAYTINDFFSNGESIPSICSLYNLSEAQVLDALKYFKRAA
jgi:uncharacterized protein (DUF433 family)